MTFLHHWKPQRHNRKRKSHRRTSARRSLVEQLETRSLMAANVFDDAFAADWSLYGWDSARDDANSTPVSEGTASIAISYQAAWGGAIFDAGRAYAVDSDDQLRFQARSETGDQELAILVIDEANEWTFVTSFTPSDSQWQEVIIDLDAIDGLSQISGFAIQEWNGGPTSTVYIDEIELTAADSSSDPGGEGQSTGQGEPGELVSDVYIDSLGEGWQNWSWESTTNMEAANGETGSAISVAYQSAYGGLYLSMPDPEIATEFNQIEFSINGLDGGQKIAVNAMDGDRTNLFAFRFTAEGDGWQRYVVDLDAIGDPTYLAGIVLQNENGPLNTPFLIDNVILSYRDSDATEARPGPSVTIDVNQVNGVIDEKVYGLNFADDALAQDIGLPIERWGGNSTSRYNYQLDSHNAGSDWYFLNVGNDSDDPSQLPNGSSVDRLAAH